MSRTAGIEVPGGKFRLAVGFVLFLGVLLFLNYGVTKLTDLLAFQMYPSNLNIAIFIVFSWATLYVFLMALPFMPGMEVGLMLMAMLCGGGIVLVCLCTVMALSLSLLFGRLLPPRTLLRTASSNFAWHRD